MCNGYRFIAGTGVVASSSYQCQLSLYNLWRFNNTRERRIMMREKPLNKFPHLEYLVYCAKVAWPRSSALLWTVLFLSESATPSIAASAPLQQLLPVYIAPHIAMSHYVTDVIFSMLDTSAGQACYRCAKCQWLVAQFVLCALDFIIYDVFLFVAYIFFVFFSGNFTSNWEIMWLL